MNGLHKFLSNVMHVAVVALAAVTLCGCGNLGAGTSSKYAPWTDLSNHYNLDKINVSGDACNFNSYELSQGLTPYTNKRLNNNEYFATVLGQKVLLRSEPKISPRTVKGSVNTGDVITVQGIPAVYVNGKFWNAVYVSSGYYAGSHGYICNDYLIEQEKYQVLRDYVFSSYQSNITIQTESKYLNAIGDILLKLNVNKTHPNLSVNLVDVNTWGNKVVTVFNICNWGVQENNSLLAYVEFTQGTNDFVVLGIVPGRAARGIMLMPNGSYEIHFAK